MRADDRQFSSSVRAHATTILGVKRDNTVAVAGDGQVTLGDVVLKHGANKIRLMHDGQVVAGFAGAVADALTLFGKFDQQLKAWDAVSAKLKKEDPFFKKVVDSQLAWAKRVAYYMFLNEADYRLGYEHIFKTKLPS